MGRNKRNNAVSVVVLVLLVSSLFVLAQQQQEQQLEQPGQSEDGAREGQECGFWCKVWGSVGKFLSGAGREKVVG